jgi:hypothetical protein
MSMEERDAAAEVVLVLPHQALMVRVCGKGVKDEVEIEDEETEIHMHNTTPDIVHYVLRPLRS